MTKPAPPNVMELRPRITVIGVGGAGCNAVNNMIDANLTGVDFVVANTDAQSLAASHAEYKVQLGTRLTEGLGAGSRPEIGQAAAEEALEDIRSVIAGSHMVFIAAGMGGGTGTGAAAVIARTARELGILTVAVVTKPFQFEGARRARIAEAGIAELRQHVDTLIVIPNQNLFRIASERTTFAEAFVLADQVLYSGVACVVDLIVKEGLINLDFADVRTVMSGMGTAMMGTGEATGEHRAIIAAEEAIANPLLDDVSLNGAKGLLLSITGGSNLTLYEVDAAATRVRQEVDPEANIIVGATFDESMGDRVRVSIVASGMQRLAASVGSQGPAEARPPAASTPPPVPAPPSRGPHASEADQSIQKMASVLQAHEFVQPTPEVAQPAEPAAPLAQASHDQRAHAALPSWYGPDEIEIEERVPGSLVQPEYAPPATGAPSTPQGFEADVFTPAPPADVRRPPRRMPELEDFPVVAQREYHAKMEHHVQPPSAAHRPPAQSRSEPRKRGFFDRLTGRKRAESDSPASGTGPHVSVQYTESPRGTSAPGRQHPRDDDPRHYGNHAERSENADLPAFFGKSRR